MNQDFDEQALITDREFDRTLRDLFKHQRPEKGDTHYLTRIVCVKPKDEDLKHRWEVLALAGVPFGIGRERFETMRKLGERYGSENGELAAVFLCVETYGIKLESEQAKPKVKEYWQDERSVEAFMVMGLTLDGRTNAASVDLMRGSVDIHSKLTGYGKTRVMRCKQKDTELKPALLETFIRGYARGFVQARPHLASRL